MTDDSPTLADEELRVFNADGPWDGTAALDPHLASDDTAINAAERKIMTNLWRSFDDAVAKFRECQTPANANRISGVVSTIISRRIVEMEREIAALRRTA